MKYIDADRLRAEIKERTLFYAGQANLLADTTTLDGFDEILSIIDSLQQERKPAWKPSEEQMKALWDAYKGGKEQEPLRELIEQLKKL